MICNVWISFVIFSLKNSSVSTWEFNLDKLTMIFPKNLYFLIKGESSINKTSNSSNVSFQNKTIVNVES